MSRKLFCEISPLTYKISVAKNKVHRYVSWMRSKETYAKSKNNKPLGFKVYNHQSLVKRTLGKVDERLQENKRINLSIAVPKVNGIMIAPGEVFSFWQLVGSTGKRKGYQEGLMIKKGTVTSDIGGGLCQFTNLIHWMVLHSPLDIIEQHHHNGLDLFPDNNRTIPFGTGTSIMHNYLDYQFQNNTSQNFQLLIWLEDTHLCGELRCEHPLPYTYEIEETEHYFTEEDEAIYRHNTVYKNVRTKAGKLVHKTLVIKNRSKVIYNRRFIDPMLIRKKCMPFEGTCNN